jgi:ferredoxin
LGRNESLKYATEFWVRNTKNSILLKKEKKMKVKVTEYCMGDRRCNDLCPEVFEYDEDELKSMVKVDEVPTQYEALVRQAADECGADAIIIEDD